MDWNSRSTMLMFVGVALNTVGALLSKRFASVEEQVFFVAVMAVLAYAADTIVWLYLLRAGGNSLVTIGVIWSVLCTLANIAIGLVYYGETLTMRTSAGVLLGVGSVFLLSL